MLPCDADTELPLKCLCKHDYPHTPLNYNKLKAYQSVATTKRKGNLKTEHYLQNYFNIQ